jgi:hypothetical protein
LHDHTQSPVPEQVSFRLDFPAWLGRQTERDRRIAEALLVGEPTLAVTRRFGLSAGRLSQKRRAWHHDWQRFQGEPAAAGG